MRTDFIEEWVDALTSEQYQQAQQQLRMTHLENTSFSEETEVVEHCCLGVACEIGIQWGVIERHGDEYRAIGEAEALDPDEMDWNSSTLPYGFWNWIGFTGHDPSVPGHGPLTKLNDEGESFDNIAKLIKEAWLLEEKTSG